MNDPELAAKPVAPIARTPTDFAEPAEFDWSAAAVATVAAEGM